MPAEITPIASRSKAPTPRVSRGSAADRLLGPGRRSQEIEHEVIGRIFDGADLLHDDVFLALEFFRVELAVGQNVADDVERQPDVVAHHPREISRPLDSGFCVEVAADVLDRLGDLARASPARAFERHVLEEVRQPVLARRSRGANPRRPKTPIAAVFTCGIASLTTARPEGRVVT